MNLEHKSTASMMANPRTDINKAQEYFSVIYSIVVSFHVLVLPRQVKTENPMTTK